MKLTQIKDMSVLNKVNCFGVKFSKKLNCKFIESTGINKALSENMKYSLYMQMQSVCNYFKMKKDM